MLPWKELIAAEISILSAIGKDSSFLGRGVGMFRKSPRLVEGAPMEITEMNECVCVCELDDFPILSFEKFLFADDVPIMSVQKCSKLWNFQDIVHKKD